MAGTAITSGTFLVPPMSDGMSGKSRRIVGNPDHESPAIFPDIVNSVRNGDPDRIGAEVMIIDATGNQFPTPAGIFEKWGSRLAPPLITLRFHPVVAMCDVRFGDRPRDYRLFEKSPENEPTCV